MSFEKYYKFDYFDLYIHPELPKREKIRRVLENVYIHICVCSAYCPIKHSFLMIWGTKNYLVEKC